MSSSVAAAFLKKYQSKTSATNDVALNERPTVLRAASPSASSPKVNGGSEECNECLCAAEGLPSCVSDWVRKRATRENWRVEVRAADVSYGLSDSSSQQRVTDSKTPIAVAIPIGGDSTAVGSLRIAGLQQRNNFPFDWAHSSPMSLRRLTRGQTHRRDRQNIDAAPRNGEGAGAEPTVETKKNEAPKKGSSYHELLLRIDSELQSAVKLLNKGVWGVSGGSELGVNEPQRHFDPASDAFAKSVQKAWLLPREEENTAALQAPREVGMCSQYQAQAHGAMTTLSSLNQETISGDTGLVGWNTSDDEAIVDSSETGGYELGENKKEVLSRKRIIRGSCWSLALRHEVAKRVMAIEKQLTSASFRTNQEGIDSGHTLVDASPFVFSGYYRWLLDRRHHQPRLAQSSAQASDDFPTPPTYFVSHIKGSINFSAESMCGINSSTSSTMNSNQMEKSARCNEIRVSGAGNGSPIGGLMAPSPFVFDPFYGVVAKTSEAKALWPRCVRIPIVLSQLRLRYLLATSNETRNATQSKQAEEKRGGDGQHTCARVANHTRQRFSILLLYTGRSSGDMMCLLPCVDGAPILSSSEDKSTQRPSSTSPHLDDDVRLSKREEQAALFGETLQTAVMIGNYVTRGKLSEDEYSTETSLDPSRTVHTTATMNPSTSAKECIFTVHIVMINVFDVERGNFDLRITPSRTSSISQRQDKARFGIVLHSRFVGFPSSKRPWDNVMSMAGDQLGKLFELEK